jgi:hypothetical protein
MAISNVFTKRQYRVSHRHCTSHFLFSSGQCYGDHTVTDRQDPGTTPVAGIFSQSANAAENADDLHEYWPGDESPSVVAALRQEFPGYGSGAS